MAFTGVNRANVAVTDTFDTWRIRTNEINNTLNLAVSANTADTVMYRDNAGSANLNVLEANTTVVTHTGTVDSALSVVSAVAAHSGGSYASILTTGGIYGTLSSKFAADLTIGTNLTVDGNTVVGSATTDILTFNATLTGDILPTTTSGAATITGGAATGSDLGAVANSFAHVYTVQETILATSGITTNVFSVTSAAGAGNTATFKNDSAALNSVILSVLSASTDTAARNLVQITNDAAAAVATTALSIQADAGKGIYINSTLAAGLPALDIDSALDVGNTVQILADTTSTGSVLEVSADALTTGKMIDLSSTGTIAGAGRVLDITADSATSGIGVSMSMDGLTTGKMIELTSTGTIAGVGRVIDITADSATSGVGLQMSMDGLTSGKMMDLSSTGTITGKVIDITADSATSGFGIDISMDALTSGSALRINSSSSHSGNLVSFVSDGAATGPTLYVRNDATTTTVKALQIANTTADIFSVTVAGDATVANDLTISGDFVVTGNLSVAGTTSEINTTTTIVKDKTLVLGTQSAVTAGVTYTAANPAVFTSASHGLSAGDVIFVVASTGTVVTGEQRLTVNATSLASGSFKAILNDETALVDGTGDSTTRTLSWVGPQTDALVDDAGIYAPGSTAVHSFKWDDTLNYWEANASLHINDTGQLLLPKGNDTLTSSSGGEKPAAAATATQPAAITGAMRYNTTNSKIEAVITSTSYENMSTETFATAIAIALG